MAKILSVVGGRPQFIKEAITGRAIRKKHEEILVHTGQHYDVEMSENLFKQLGIINPKYNLGVGSGSHAKMTAAIMIGIEEVLQKESPDIVLVYGDMNSTMAAAVTAAKLNIPVAHIEAGARNYVFDMPEEQNRIITDHIATWDFAIKKQDYEILINEGLEKYSYNVGDVMLDSLYYYKEKVKEKNIEQYWNEIEYIGNKPNIPNDWYLATTHRPENTDDIELLKNILSALQELPSKVIMPVHPRIRKKVDEIKETYSFDNIIFVKPLGYLETIYFMTNSLGVVTDSGGLQRECYWSKIPCTVLLRNTVDKHMIKGNCLVFSRPYKEDILKSVMETKIDISEYDNSPYGDGHACDKISEILTNPLSR